LFKNNFQTFQYHKIGILCFFEKKNVSQKLDGWFSPSKIWDKLKEADLANFGS
jgi:hypothetical protein